MNLCCPACGHVILVGQGEGAVVQQQTAPPPGSVAQQPPPGATSGLSGSGSGIRVSLKEGKWRIQCPDHDWHGAKLWPAKGNKPAVVKCTGQDESTGEFCEQKVTHEEAKRQVGGA